MVVEIVLQRKIGQMPHLHRIIPATRDDDRVLRRRAKLDRRHPLGVALFVLLAPLELAQCIPESDALVSSRADDLAIIGGEGHRENVVFVANKSSSGYTSLKVPQTESFVPGG